VHQLARAAAEPAISYATPDGHRKGVDDFLGNNRTMGLLVLQGDRILVERYQYERTAEQRFHSQSIAKTVVAMLVRHRAAGREHSLDRRPRAGLRSGAGGLALRKDQPAALADNVIGRELSRDLPAR
jgi:hypothetical protein